MVDAMPELHLPADEWDAFLANDPTHADIVRMVRVLAPHLGTESLDLIHPSGEAWPIDVQEAWTDALNMLDTWSGKVDAPTTPTHDMPCMTIGEAMGGIESVLTPEQHAQVAHCLGSLEHWAAQQEDD